MNSGKTTRTRRIVGTVLSMLLLLTLPFAGTGCTENACKIFNCDTLFWVDSLSDTLGTMFTGTTVVDDDDDGMDMDDDDDGMDMDDDHDDDDDDHDG